VHARFATSVPRKTITAAKSTKVSHFARRVDYTVVHLIEFL